MDTRSVNVQSDSISCNQDAQRHEVGSLASN